MLTLSIPLMEDSCYLWLNSIATLGVPEIHHATTDFLI